MLKTGLTGSIGSGKTLVSKVFFTLGVPVFHADDEAKKFLHDAEVKRKIAAEISESVFDHDERIINSKLASIVFNDPQALKKLNKIIHPRVREALKQWFAKQQDHPYAIYEAAILFESGFYREMDKIITVSAPESLRIQRVMKRDGVTEGDVLKRIRNQWPDEKKLALADWIINNDEKAMLIPQVLEIHHRLTVKS